MKGKKRKALIAACVLSGCIFACILAILAAGRRPFRELEADRIVSAFVQLSPPGETVQITEMEEMTEYLRDVVIYQRDDSYTEYAGQAAIFTLMLSDGTQTTVMEYYPFLIIDGIGYRAKYEPCEALNAYANRLAAK